MCARVVTTVTFASFPGRWQDPDATTYDAVDLIMKTHERDERNMKLDEIWSKEQMHTLGTYGIFLPMIKDAYRHLTKLEVIAFKRFSSSG